MDFTMQTLAHTIYRRSGEFATDAAEIAMELVEARKALCVAISDKAQAATRSVLMSTIIAFDEAVGSQYGPEVANMVATLGIQAAR